MAIESSLSRAESLNNEHQQMQFGQCDQEVEANIVGQDTDKNKLPYYFKCDSCSESFRSSKLLEKHFRTSVVCSGYLLCKVCISWVSTVT